MRKKMTSDMILLMYIVNNYSITLVDEELELLWVIVVLIEGWEYQSSCDDSLEDCFVKAICKGNTVGPHKVESKGPCYSARNSLQIFEGHLISLVREPSLLVVSICAKEQSE
jgi:hypothetical protein